MGRVAGKTVLITGAARGQGRSHALCMAREGADIVGLDLCADIESAGYPLARKEELEETARLVRETGRRIVVRQADVREPTEVRDAVAAGVSEFGALDGVVANAGICPVTNTDPQSFIDVANTNFLGVANTVTAALPHLGPGSSIVATGSIAAMMPNLGTGGAGGLGYAWAKRTVSSYVNDLAIALGPQRIRVNVVHPTNVNTDMFQSDPMYRVFRPDLENPTREDAEPAFRTLHPMPLGYVEASDISAAVLYLLSDESRYVTGTQLRVDAGAYAMYFSAQPPHVI